jgi:hypothetical protein
MKIAAKSMFASALLRIFVSGLLFVIIFTARVNAIIPVSSQDVIAARGWDMVACRVPIGPNTTAPIYFANGEIISMPIHINNLKDVPDLRDIYISGNPVFLWPVEMGESRYAPDGNDKYADVISCFQNGIDFNVPDSPIIDEAVFEETINRFRDSTKPAYSFTPAGTVTTWGSYKANAVQLEFFVEEGIGKVRITNNCSVKRRTATPYDYEIVPASDGNTFRKYNIYDYHCKPTSETPMVIPVEDTYVTQYFDDYEGDPAGQIFVDGNVVIGGADTANPDMVVKGNITIVATGYIWVADSIFVDGPHDANDLPTADNPNILNLIAARLIKIVNPTSINSPSVPSGQVYQPIGITQDGNSGRFLPDPTVIEAGITVGGGGWGAEGVGSVNGGRREYDAPQDNLVVHGAISEVLRGVVGLVGADGYKKYYSYDQRLRKTGLFVLTPDGGENIANGSIYTIQWSSHGCISDILIEYSTDDGQTWEGVNPPNTGNSGIYNWVVPKIDSNDCLVRVSEAGDPDISDISDQTFRIFECPLNSRADLNSDCKVDFQDFSLFAEEWLLNGNVPDTNSTE